MFDHFIETKHYRVKVFPFRIFPCSEYIHVNFTIQSVCAIYLFTQTGNYYHTNEKKDSVSMNFGLVITAHMNLHELT